MIGHFANFGGANAWPFGLEGDLLVTSDYTLTGANIRDFRDVIVDSGAILTIETDGWLYLGVARQFQNNGVIRVKNIASKEGDTYIGYKVGPDGLLTGDTPSELTFEQIRGNGGKGGGPGGALGDGRGAGGGGMGGENPAGGGAEDGFAPGEWMDDWGVGGHGGGCGCEFECDFEDQGPGYDGQGGSNGGEDGPGNFGPGGEGENGSETDCACCGGHDECCRPGFAGGGGGGAGGYATFNGGLLYIQMKSMSFENNGDINASGQQFGDFDEFWGSGSEDLMTGGSGGAPGVPEDDPSSGGGGGGGSGGGGGGCVVINTHFLEYAPANDPFADAGDVGPGGGSETFGMDGFAGSDGEAGDVRIVSW